MLTLAQATLDDVVASVDNLYVEVSNNTIAVYQQAELVYSVLERVKGIYSAAIIIAFFVLFLIGWIVYGRMRARGGFFH